MYRDADLIRKQANEVSVRGSVVARAPGGWRKGWSIGDV